MLLNKYLLASTKQDTAASYRWYIQVRFVRSRISSLRNVLFLCHPLRTAEASRPLEPTPLAWLRTGRERGGGEEEKGHQGMVLPATDTDNTDNGNITQSTINHHHVPRSAIEEGGGGRFHRRELHTSDLSWPSYSLPLLPLLVSRRHHRRPRCHRS